MIDCLRVCAGHPDYNFVHMISAKKGVSRSHTGAASAILDEYAPVFLNGEILTQTVRSTTCAMVVHDVKCKSLKKYRATLRAMYSRWTSHGHSLTTDTTSHVNERYMTSPEIIGKMKEMKKRIHTAESELRNLQKKLQGLTKQNGEKVDNNLHNDLLSIMRENTDKIRVAYPEGSFNRLFWEEQLQASTANDSRQVRWHPLMTRWCLNMKLLSSATYHEKCRLHKTAI